MNNLNMNKSTGGSNAGEKVVEKGGNAVNGNHGGGFLTTEKKTCGVGNDSKEDNCSSVARKRLFKDKIGSFQNEPIKVNKELDGKILNVYTVVTDSAEEDENFTEVKYDLVGGIGEVHTTLSKKVSQQGESVFYELEVFFFKI